MAKRKSGGSLTSLQNQKKRLKQQLAARKKKVKDAQRAAKLRREIAALKNQVKKRKGR